MTSHSSTINKEALQELQITVTSTDRNAILSRDGTLESEPMIDKVEEIKAEPETEQKDEDLDEIATEIENHYEARRMSESSTGEAIKKRLGSRKKTKYRNQDKYRSRHPSSGGESSTDLHHSMKIPKTRLSLLAKPGKYRSRTKSEPPEEPLDDSPRPKFRSSHDEENENLEDYDEFDLLAE